MRKPVIGPRGKRCRNCPQAIVSHCREITDTGTRLQNPAPRADKHYDLRASFAPAQNDFHEAYLNGHGVPQDSAEAIKRYELAAGQGEPVVYLGLGQLIAEGRGASKNLPRLMLGSLWRSMLGAGEARDAAEQKPAQILTGLSAAELETAQSLIRSISMISVDRRADLGA